MNFIFKEAATYITLHITPPHLSAHHRPVMLLDPDSFPRLPSIHHPSRKKKQLKSTENQHEIETKGEKFLARRKNTRDLCVYTFKGEACAQLRAEGKFSVGNKRGKVAEEKQFSFDFCPCFCCEYLTTRRKTVVD